MSENNPETGSLEATIRSSKQTPSDDFFEAALFMEDTIIEEGKIQGRIAGLQKGYRDGENLVSIDFSPETMSIF